MRTLHLLLAACALAGATACSPPSAAKCSRNSDCPRDAICVIGVCQKGVPSGGTSSPAAAAGRLTGGTFTMDAVVGQPIVPAGTAGAKSMKPAENTR